MAEIAHSDERIEDGEEGDPGEDKANVDIGCIGGKGAEIEEG